MDFPGLEKSWTLRKMAEVMEKSQNFIFWSKYLMMLKTENILLVIKQKINVPKKAGFSAYLSYGKFKLVMEKSLNFIAQFLCESSATTRIIN